MTTAWLHGVPLGFTKTTKAGAMSEKNWERFWIVVITITIIIVFLVAANVEKAA
jgi:hypothetical protein